MISSILRRECEYVENQLKALKLKDFLKGQVCVKPYKSLGITRQVIHMSEIKKKFYTSYTLIFHKKMGINY